MRIAFRQGLVSFQKNAGSPFFLEASTTSGFVQHSVNPTPTLVTFAHGNANYLQKFDRTVPQSWGPLQSGVTNYLYWDIDLLTANVTRGITTLAPVFSLTPPSFPANNQHWFDLANTTMKVWNTGRYKWQPKIRVFAGHVTNGNVNTIVPYNVGSQVGLTGPSDHGYIITDILSQPLRNSRGEFMTGDTPVILRSTVGAAGVIIQPATRIVTVRAGESIPSMSLVYFSEADTVRLASSAPNLMPARTPIGLVTEDVATGDLANLVQFGEIISDSWNWSATPGAPLYCGLNGEITTVRPVGLFAYRVGFVKNTNTVLLNIDAETIPQLYTVNTSDLLITGTPPVGVTDTTNGMGERVVTISVSNATGSLPGLMTASQFNQLSNHAVRLTTAETNITTLQTNKADAIHTHGIGSVTGLQAALDGKAAASHIHVVSDITNLQTLLDGKAAISHSHVINDVTGLQTALNGKTDVGHSHAISAVTGLQAALDGKLTAVVGGTVGNLVALGAGGTVVPTAIDPSTVSLNTHVHGIAGVTGLQGALDAKANRAHLNSFAEIFTTVNRAGATDVGSGATLTDALAAKADVAHGHVPADISGGTAGQVLTSNGTGGTWATPAASSSNLANMQYAVVADAFSINVNNGVPGLVLTPAAALSTGTVTMPTTPADGQVVRVATTQIISTLTINAAAGQNIAGSPASASGTFVYVYRSADSTWYRIG